MFRSVIRLTAVASGSYVIYRVCDHPVVKADALTLIHGTPEWDPPPPADSSMRPLLQQIFQRWLSAFYLEDKTTPTESRKIRQNLKKEDEMFRENSDEQACLLGSYEDSSVSRLLRFAIPFQKTYSSTNGIFTVSASGSPIDRHPNGSRARRFVTALLVLVKKIILHLLPIDRVIRLLIPYHAATFEDRTVSIRDEFFPVQSGDSHSFDIHSWKTDCLYRSNDENNIFFFNLCQKLYSHFPCDKEILLIVDPLGAAGALQLVDYLNNSRKSASERRESSKVQVLYVKPDYWENTTTVDQRLHESILEYQRSCDVKKANCLCITRDYQQAIQKALDECSDSAMVIALLTDESMSLFKKLRVGPRTSAGLHVLRISLV